MSASAERNTKHPLRRKPGKDVMGTLTIQYRFKFSDTVEQVFDLQIDAEKFELLNNIPEVVPAWANLEFHQCPHCPLSLATHPYCPAAANVARVVPHFKEFLPYAQTRLSVVTPERTILKDTTLQEGVGSLIGLIMPASGCPYTAFFKPMARFHLPMASTEETIYRCVSMYLMAQYYFHKAGKPVDFDFKGLEKIYEDIHTVNTSMAERFLAASQIDSSVDAIVQLDIYAMTFLGILEEPIEEIRHLFHAYLQE
jgi:hypothetical protein